MVQILIQLVTAADDPDGEVALRTLLAAENAGKRIVLSIEEENEKAGPETTSWGVPIIHSVVPLSTYPDGA